jgi:hypothetical protein
MQCSPTTREGFGESGEGELYVIKTTIHNVFHSSCYFSLVGIRSACMSQSRGFI